MKKENIKVTPDMAKQFLDRNNNLRSISKVRVRLYSREMVRGEWEAEHPDPIMFDAENRLRNGQHRLAAVIEAGVPVCFCVWFGCSEALIQIS